MEKEFLKKLRELLPEEFISTDTEDRICCSYDGTRQSVVPDMTVKPVKAESVSILLKLASEHSIPVYTRGAGTGLSGGAVPVKKGIVLDMSLMNRIIAIDSENMTAVVEPGVVTAELQKKAEQLRLFYPPDPASAEFCTIGGNVAENAGGLRCIKYGVTRDYVLSLEAVLPDGRIINAGRPTLKSVTGYDLARLLTGSEGTLCVFTKITLKLIPLPKKVETVTGYFPRTEDALDAAAAVLSAGELPRALEFMDENTIAAVLRYKQFPVPEGTTASLLVEYDGNGIDVATAARTAEQILSSRNALGTTLAADAGQRAEMWAFRKSASPALYAVTKNKMSEDIAVPRSELIGILSEIREISRTYDIPIAVFGHAGDGNLHVNFLPAENQSGRENIEKAVEKLFVKTIEVSGTLSGEHGIGNTKSRFLHLELGNTELELMRSIKRVIDPRNILNPGKMLET